MRATAELADRLTELLMLAYAVTIDAAQSLTKSEGIVVMPEGSGQVT